VQSVATHRSLRQGAKRLCCFAMQIEEFGHRGLSGGVQDQQTNRLRSIDGK
jgi:hypothetical protein